MWEYFLLSVTVCVCMGQVGDANKAYFLKRPEKGFFSINLAVLLEQNQIRCACACAATLGCAAVSFSKNQSLCALTEGKSQYVLDVQWVTLDIQDNGSMTFPAASSTGFTTEISTSVNDISSLDTTTSSRTSSESNENIFSSSTVHVGTPSTENTGGDSVFSTEYSSDSQKITTTDSVPSTGMTSVELPITTVPGLTCPSGFIKTASNRCFYVSHHYESYTAATSACQNANSYLAAITSETENSELVAIVRASWDGFDRDVFLGGSDAASEGHWVWDTGEPFVYENWLTNFPSQFHPAADCLGLAHRDGWQWKDIICTREYYFVCETDPA